MLTVLALNVYVQQTKRKQLEFAERSHFGLEFGKIEDGETSTYSFYF